MSPWEAWHLMISLVVVVAGGIAENIGKAKKKKKKKREGNIGQMAGLDYTKGGNV